MHSPEDYNANGGMDFFIQHPGREVDVAHYFRQVAITRRRHVPWINRIWRQNRQATEPISLWKQ